MAFSRPPGPQYTGCVEVAPAVSERARRTKRTRVVRCNGQCGQVNYHRRTERILLERRLNGCDDVYVSASRRYTKYVERQLLLCHDRIAMPRTHELFHGSPADGILSIMNAQSMRPDLSGKIFYSERFEDALQHGADMKRGASFAFKALVTVPDGATVERTTTHGNPLAVVVKTTLPLPTNILELYVRVGRVGQFELKVVRGAGAIHAYLLKA